MNPLPSKQQQIASQVDQPYQRGQGSLTLWEAQTLNISPTGNGYELVRVIAKFRKCPIQEKNPGTLVMTKKGFAEACLMIQIRREYHGKELGKYAKVNSCTKCKLGKRIKNGKDFKAPAGIIFVSLKTLLYRRRQCQLLQKKSAAKK